MKKKGFIRAVVTAFLISILFCFPSLADEKGITAIGITASDKIEGWIIVFIVIVVLAFIVLGKFLPYNIKLADGTKVKRVPTQKIEPISMLPFKMSIPMICAELNLDPFSFIPEPIAAYLIKWQLEEIIQIEDVNDEPVIHFLRIPEGENVEMVLFEMLKNVGDGKTLILEEWKEWATEHNEELLNWCNTLESYGDSLLRAEGWTSEDNKDITRFTQRGFDMHNKMLGFHKFLKSFEKSPSDLKAPSEYWGDYLIFAALCSLTEPVAMGLQKIDTIGFNHFCGMYHMNSNTFMICLNHATTISESSYIDESDVARDF